MGFPEDCFMTPRSQTQCFCAASIATALIFGTAAAQAQANRPDSHERELAQIITSAGHDCPQIESISTPQNSEPGWDVLRPEVVVCRNGKRFMIVTSGRRNALPIVRPLPSIGERT
jgi:hypothetical protein